MLRFLSEVVLNNITSMVSNTDSQRREGTRSGRHSRGCLCERVLMWHPGTLSKGHGWEIEAPVMRNWMPVTHAGVVMVVETSTDKGLKASEVRGREPQALRHSEAVSAADLLGEWKWM
ncbi:hypothetical protein EYF80_026384 [Liparis tanakae]|uniref:Uncharacterized protein n=1 Tax=Liparis tanakae TaxID=230148 RepID=A0A4Z2HC33_9TELE|nr:hypothetical protein EYF80_026384 [Liparis tanakae]